jgi:hypothetical protein
MCNLFIYIYIYIYIYIFFNVFNLLRSIVSFDCLRFLSAFLVKGLVCSTPFGHITELSLII